ncbi:isoprenyl transferase [Prosthecomicrobium sp. N25]|uniref:isoprenyl transferase n=1 Tax=Prosthecomicrobium sp. N25 TaxID=3129254 RepID=UPI003077113D
MPTLEASPDQRPLAGTAGLPRHVAIIMDGNGRWATARGLARTEGHRKGLDTVRRIVRHAGHIGLEVLTLYSFSSENWRRPPDEVTYLMGLLRFFIRRDLAELHANNVRIRVVGERDGLWPDIRALLEEAETLTAGNTGLALVIAFNYGARQEIVRAMRRIAEAVKAGAIDPSEIGEETIARHLDTAGIPDPDLVIRTSGEKRISNFLLWQSAYAEYVFPATCWPDFDEAEFDRAVAEYQARERRFGGVEARSAP